MSLHLSIRISQKTKQNLELLSKRLGISLSELVRNILEIISKISEVQEEKSLKIEIVKSVLEILERLVKKSRDIEIHIRTYERKDYPEQTPYYLCFECYNGKCRAVVKSENTEQPANLRDIAKALLEDCYWDIRSVVELIKSSIR